MPAEGERGHRGRDERERCVDDEHNAYEVEDDRAERVGLERQEEHAEVGEVHREEGERALERAHACRGDEPRVA